MCSWDWNIILGKIVGTAGSLDSLRMRSIKTIVLEVVTDEYPVV